jgi:hypothetical protein
MTGDAGERREFIRIPFNTEVEVDVGGRVIRSNKGINISVSGIHLSTDDSAPPRGTLCRVSVKLYAPENRVTIEAGGKISRSVPGSLAIEFTELDVDCYHHLRRLILLNADEPERAEQEFIAHWGIRRPAF